jgi:DNA-binding NarL/FixJ family response regulator
MGESVISCDSERPGDGERHRSPRPGALDSARIRYTPESRVHQLRISYRTTVVKRPKRPVFRVAESETRIWRRVNRPFRRDQERRRKTGKQPSRLTNFDRCRQTVTGERHAIVTRALLVARSMSKPVPSAELEAAAGDKLARTGADYWKRRLLQRKYGEWDRPANRGEYSAQIEHEGTSWFFPLGTDDSPKAATAALQIYETVVGGGWPAACAQFAREFTVAIFWSTNPAACTYTTLFTTPAPAAAGSWSKVSAARIKVGIVEPDPDIARALGAWLNRCPGCACVNRWPTGAEALRQLRSAGLDLLLFNRHLADVPLNRVLEEAARTRPALPAFSHGIYETSDDVFISLTGVDGGYFFRRRPPLAMLEPVDAAWAEGPPALQQVHARAQNYFQSLLILPPSNERSTDIGALTHREQEILHCLRKGLHDKEIARTLKISAWTVHTHLKNIFEKLKVHTRTEAVIKYLQK